MLDGVSLVGGDDGGGGCVGGEEADEGIDGISGRGIPHPSSRTGYFQVFFFLRGDASGLSGSYSKGHFWQNQHVVSWSRGDR